MDFFAQQEAARRKSVGLSLLAAVFVLPVVWFTSRALKFATLLVWRFLLADRFSGGEWSADPAAEMIFWGVAALMVLVGGVVAYLRTASGERVMRLVGARRANCDDELPLVNIAEELSLASGMAIPSLWVMDDARDINAFAAGHTAADAAICVTKGALRKLTRDELQGVVAHEFGHILNGDMRVNTHLSAMVEGLGAISTVGRTMLRPFGKLFCDRDEEGEHQVGIRLGRGKGGGGLVILIVIYLLLGTSLWLIGLVGVFFARILQGAVSREREYLADAAAVQFTRNPEGLADALRFTRLMPRYAVSYGTSSMRNVAHMFFIAEAFSCVRSHPPIAERVRRLSSLGLDARDGAFRVRLNRIKAERDARVRENRERYIREQAMKAALNPRMEFLPLELCRRLRTTDGAGAVLVSLLKGEILPEWPGELTPQIKRQLVMKAMTTIGQRGSAAERMSWADRIERITEESGEMGSFEFMVSCSVRRKLRGYGAAPFRPAKRLVVEAANVVATIASFGANTANAYQLAGRRLRPLFGSWPPASAPYTSVRRFREALDALRALMPIAKREFLWAIRTVIAEDGEVTEDEANYLSAVAEAIDTSAILC